MSALTTSLVIKAWATIKANDAAVPLPERIPTEVFQAAHRYEQQGDDPIWAATSAVEEYEDAELGRLMREEGFDDE